MPKEPGEPKDLVVRPREKEDFHGKDFYQILGVPRDATSEQIKAAYKQRSKQIHPDRRPPEDRDYYTELFKQLLEAYDVLTDQMRRLLYDVDFDDIFSVAAKRARYYRPATEKDVNQELYNAEVAWLEELAEEERERLRMEMVEYAHRYTRRVIEKRFPGLFGRGYSSDNYDWVSKRMSKLLSFDETEQAVSEYPKGEKTADDLFVLEMDELGRRYRNGLPVIAENFKHRARFAAERFHQPIPKEHEAPQKKEGADVDMTGGRAGYKKEFQLGSLLITYTWKDETYSSKGYRISAVGQQRPEVWDEIIWHENGVIVAAKEDQVVMLSPATGEPMSAFYEKLEFDQGLLIATEGKRGATRCIVSPTTAKELSKKYHGLVIADSNNAQGFIAGEGVFTLEINGENVTETKSE